MGLRDWFRGPQPAPRSSSEIEVLTAPRSAEARAFNSSAFPSNGDQFGGFSGFGGVNDRTAMQHLAVYACVRLLADSIASLPVDVYRKAKGSSVRVPLETPPVLVDPDTDINDFEYMQQVVTSLALRGNSYEYITGYDNLERPASRMPIHPDDVQVTKNKQTGLPEYKINNNSVPYNRVIHIRRLTLPGQVEGLSPVRQAAQAIGMGLAAERFGARWFADSANPSAILHTDAEVSDEEMTRIMKTWVSTHGGRRLPAILTGGLDYKPISITPEESQFLQTRDFQRSEIAMFFGIPPHMIGDTTKATSWGSGIEQLGIGFVKYSLMPWLRCIESTYSRMLLPRGQYMRFNVDALLRGDTISRYSAYTQARNAGWLSPNEIRAKEDMLPIPNGDDYMQPLNMGPLGSDPLAASSGSAQGGDPNAQS